MAKSSEWTELKETVSIFAVWTATCLIEGFFLSIWVAVQWVLRNKVFVPLKLAGWDDLILAGLQILFSVSTLAPVGITIYRDIRVMLLRAQHKIREESEITRRQ